MNLNYFVSFKSILWQVKAFCKFQSFNLYERNLYNFKDRKDASWINCVLFRCSRFMRSGHIWTYVHTRSPVSILLLLLSFFRTSMIRYFVNKSIWKKAKNLFLSLGCARAPSFSLSLYKKIHLVPRIFLKLNRILKPANRIEFISISNENHLTISEVDKKTIILRFALSLSIKCDFYHFRSE